MRIPEIAPLSTNIGTAQAQTSATSRLALPSGYERQYQSQPVRFSIPERLECWSPLEPIVAGCAESDGFGGECSRRIPAGKKRLPSAEWSETFREHLSLVLVVAQEDTIMKRVPRKSHDLAHYVGLNAALFALIFVSLVVAGAI